MGSQREAMKNEIDPLLKKLFKTRNKFLEEFCKAYLAVNCKTVEEAKKLIEGIELVEETRTNEIVFYFRPRFTRKDLT